MSFSHFINKNTLILSAPSLINIAIFSYVLWYESKIIEVIFEVFISSIGGIFAALLTFYLTAKVRTKNKRLDKYVEHRNTLVQIEHELIPARVSMDNNLKALEDAIQQNDQGITRLILRMHKLDLSTGLSLKLLSLELINNYAELYVSLKKINSDIDYLDQIVEKIQIWADERKNIASLIIAYEKLIKYLVVQCQKADKNMLEIVAKCQIAILLDESKDEFKLKYQNDGEEVKYDFDKIEINLKKKNLEKQENMPYTDSETHEQIFMLYLDLHLVA